MQISQISTESLTQPVRQTLYNNTNNQSQLQQLDSIQFLGRKRKSMSDNRKLHDEPEFYLNAEFIPRMPAKQLAATPKFLFSLERKRLRIRNGISTKNNMGSQMQRTFFKSQVPKKPQKYMDRCKHTHEVHNTKTPQWCIVPPLIVKQKPDLPHFLFNMHHMNDRQNDNSMEEIQRRAAKGANTSFYGCSSSHRAHRRTAQATRSALSMTRRSEYKEVPIE